MDIEVSGVPDRTREAASAATRTGALVGNATDSEPGSGRDTATMPKPRAHFCSLHRQCRIY